MPYEDKDRNLKVPDTALDLSETGKVSIESPAITNILIHESDEFLDYIEKKFEGVKVNLENIVVDERGRIVFEDESFYEVVRNRVGDVGAASRTSNTVCNFGCDMK